MAEPFATLRAIMLDNAPGMLIARDEPGDLSLETSWKNPRKPVEAMWFGGVKLGKAYVSYHLMPVYSEADVRRAIPEILRRRQQGKSCFNFKTIDPAQAEALAQLTATAALAYGHPPAE